MRSQSDSSKFLVSLTPRISYFLFSMFSISIYGTSIMNMQDTCTSARGPSSDIRSDVFSRTSQKKWRTNKRKLWKTEFPQTGMLNKNWNQFSPKVRKCKRARLNNLSSRQVLSKSSHGHQSRSCGVNIRRECETTWKYNAKTSIQKHCWPNEKSKRCTNPVVSDQTVNSLRSRPFRAPMRFWPWTRCIARHESVSGT